MRKSKLEDANRGGLGMPVSWRRPPSRIAPAVKRGVVVLRQGAREHGPAPRTSGFGKSRQGKRSKNLDPAGSATELHERSRVANCHKFSTDRLRFGDFDAVRTLAVIRTTRAE